MQSFKSVFDIEHTKHGADCNTAASVTMNKADSERIRELCALIDKEQDRRRFLALVKELNDVLSAKDARLQGSNRAGEES
jgi:hypothetical protein